jgi:hypothetical protein
VLEFLARAVKHDKEMKEIQTRKYAVNLSLCAHYIFLYLKDTEVSFENFCMIYTVQTQINVTAVTNVKKEMKKTIPFTRGSNKFLGALQVPALQAQIPEFKPQSHPIRKISLE